MADYYGAASQSIAILKYALGGTNLYSQWAAGGSGTTAGDGSIYQAFQSTVHDGLAALQAANPGSLLKIEGMVWMQGENDAVPTYSSQYQVNLTNFINDVRLTYGANLPFVLGKLSSAQTGTGAAVDRENVRSAQASVASTVPDVGIVVTDSFTLNSDHLHFDAAGQQNLGNAFATVMQGLVPPVIGPGEIEFESGVFSSNLVLALAGTPARQLYGVDYGANVAQTTANGYSFAAANTSNATYDVPGNYPSFLSGGGTTGDPVFNTVLNTGRVGGGGTGSLTLNNLTAGMAYKALFLLSDTRSGVGTRTFSISQGTSASPVQTYAFPGGSSAMGGYVLCTFAATSPTATFNVNNSYGRQLNAVLVCNASPVVPQFTGGAFGNSSVLSLIGTPAQESYGVDLGGTSAQTVGGYAFAVNGSSNVSYDVAGNYGSFLSGGGTTGNAAFDSVLNSGRTGSGAGPFVLNNLTAGVVYKALFLVADTRAGVGARNFGVSMGTHFSSNQGYTFIGGTPSVGGYILCTFTATAPTQTFLVNTAPGRQLNAILIGHQ